MESLYIRITASITVDDQVAKEITSTKGTFGLCDPTGKVIAIACADGSSFPVVLDPPLPTGEELKRILNGPRYTTEQVLEGF